MLSASRGRPRSNAANGAGGSLRPRSGRIGFGAPSVRGRPVAQLLADELRGVGAWLRPELLHAAAEHFGDVEVAVLVHRQRMGASKLAGVRAGLAPSVQVIPVQVVLEDSVRPAVRYPPHLIRRGRMSVGPGDD